MGGQAPGGRALRSVTSEPHLGPKKGTIEGASEVEGERSQGSAQAGSAMGAHVEDASADDNESVKGSATGLLEENSDSLTDRLADVMTLMGPLYKTMPKGRVWKVLD